MGKENRLRKGNKPSFWIFYILFEVLLLWVAFAHGEMWGISGALTLWAGLSVVYWILKLVHKMFDHLTVISVLASVMFAAMGVFGISHYLAKQGTAGTGSGFAPLLLETLEIAVLLLPLIAAALAACMEEGLTTRGMWANFKKIYPPMLVLAFMFYVYLPSESFIGNKSDFEFTYQMFIFRNLFLAVFGSMAAAIFIGAMKKKFIDAAGVALFGLVTAIYIQYMFLNGKLGLIDGGSPDWSRYTVDIIIGYIVWAILLAIPIVLMRRWARLWEKLRVGIPAALGGVQFLTLCTLLLTASDDIYRLDLNYMSPQEQFTVSAKDNLILFVMDSMDNAYVKRLLETEPEVFEGLEDFTVYLNTCSVFDYTKPSMTQMLTGMDFAVELPGAEWYERAWSSERAAVFYERFHEADYTINGFNMDNNIVDKYAGKYDNYGQYEEEELQNMIVDKDRMYDKLSELALYRVLPMGLKPLIDSKNLTFTGIVKIQEKACYENEDYMRHLRLTVSDVPNNYFVVEHLEGTHLSAHALTDAKYVFGIVKEYIRQMRELGVYDDATIIVTADHGEHNAFDFAGIGTPMAQAATPIFMVREKGVHREELVMNHAPIYHEDIQATLLDCAGLYDSLSDREMFGLSIFDIEEDALRERTWYDRQPNDHYPPVSRMGASTIMTNINTYYGYTYVGDMETLDEMVGEMRYTQIYPMTDYKE